ncbi:MAG: pirin family protein [Deltaproteobacteria bacterium]|jgi:redox-sensitive bicupin YhaK (pirin superfamily)|nr:pirin family protein [Deltaproteobacteria bacterium]
MSKREIVKTVRGRATVDGAGVHLVRVLNDETVVDFDPFLMLDSFDSKNPPDYTKGFPMHPHRGIETITYLIDGEMEHEDSLGNKGTIKSGESQWMTAGSGIMHQEMPQASDRMLGLQIWLNLPQKDKMTDPVYFDIKKSMIPEVKSDQSTVRVISGQYQGAKGVTPAFVKATLYDVSLEAGQKIEIPTNPEENVFIFLILGDASIGKDTIKEKTAVLFGPGDTIEVGSLANAGIRFIYFSGPKLKEPVAWAGPIVMNTEEELENTFRELRQKTFIKHAAHNRD